MEFGVGLLGQGWDIEEHTEQLLVSAAPARPNMIFHASCYAAKIAAETVLAYPPSDPDLSDEGIIRRLAWCAPAVRPSETSMVRDAFLAEFGSQQLEFSGLAA